MLHVGAAFLLYLQPDQPLVSHCFVTMTFVVWRCSAHLFPAAPEVFCALLKCRAVFARSRFSFVFMLFAKLLFLVGNFPRKALSILCLQDEQVGV